MKSIILLTLTLLISSFIFSQKAEITYVASTSYVVDLSKNDTQNVDVEQSVSDIEYKLYINKNKSYYKKEESLRVDGSSINMTSVLGGSGIYYYNLTTTKNLLEKSGRLGDFLIEFEKINWVLTNETKKIGNYTCLKATAIVLRKRMDRYTERKIIAWYTPEIALNFGPKNYNGLPGLILSLQEGKLYLVAKIVVLNPKEDIVIPVPNKDFERITFKEHEKLLSKKFDEFRKKRKKNR